MKAIHNEGNGIDFTNIGVVTMSKVEKMKAIHNPEGVKEFLKDGVVTMSKVEKMKAIHNSSPKMSKRDWVL